MRILAIDTTEEACSAALYIDHEVQSRYAVAPRKHSELILPMMDELLAQAGLRAMQLDALAFARGPGSFTGLRIAAGVAQGVALAADIPVVPVSSLQALAQGAHRQHGAGKVLAAFDARMNEVYYGSYMLQESLLVPSGSEVVCAPEAVTAVTGEGWCGAGSGWRTYRDVLLDTLGTSVADIQSDLMVHAQDVAVLAADGFGRGTAVAPEQALPVYLRDTVAQKRR